MDRFDAYIDRAAPFAQPILRHLRTLVHAACPGVEETIKWGMPHYVHHGILASMAAFKQHASFALQNGANVLGDAVRDDAMGHLGRLTSLADLPPDAELIDAIRRAAALNEQGKRPRTKNAQPKPPPVTPDDLRDALQANAAAQATFDGFAPSCRREYIDWIEEAKRAETRSKRVAQAVEWMAEGRKRNWKYENC